ncbi:FTR1 family protein [Roseateles sp.]|uniref:FTR1 family iron permease n=1 Tax=Roseateles sp. TaxID=1971397 RepID=UPI00394D22FE
MFSAALIVFRESLEAALFVGIVAAATRGLAGRSRWLATGVGLGVIGAALLALLAGRISEAFDGIGQDLVTIGILATALAMLLWHCLWVSTHSQQMVREARQLGSSVHAGQRRPWALIGAVALAVLREGAETVLFVAGSATDEGGALAPGVLGAGTVGLLAGVALGWLVYAGLSRIPVRHLFTATNALIALLAASIASQLMRALAQAGLLQRWVDPLWDTSHLLSPDSAVGTLAHALVGYDAQPSGAQFMAYVAVITLIVVGTRLQQAKTR